LNKKPQRFTGVVVAFGMPSSWIRDELFYGVVCFHLLLPLASTLHVVLQLQNWQALD
jgi:hypothetical protein